MLGDAFSLSACLSKFCEHTRQYKCSSAYYGRKTYSSENVKLCTLSDLKRTDRSARLTKFLAAFKILLKDRWKVWRDPSENYGT